jgi:hypothetical protein
MDTNSLMKKYAKSPMTEIENTNFIIISSRIHLTKDRDNVLVATNLFISAGMLKGVGYEIETDSYLARQNFKSFLLREPKPLTLICSMIECFLTAGENSVLLCSPNELKTGYMQVITEVIEDLFHFPIRKYPNEEPFDFKDVAERVLYYKEQVSKLRLLKMRPTELRKYVNKLSKKELKKELKKRYLPYKDMDIEEMRHLLEENFTEGVKL